MTSEGWAVKLVIVLGDASSGDMKSTALPPAYLSHAHYGILQMEECVMSVVIRMHFDGKVFVPDQPVDVPINEPLDFELKQSQEELKWDPEKAVAAMKRIASRAKPIGIPLEALRRENMYEERGL
jgi:hypothetical protein